MLRLATRIDLAKDTNALKSFTATPGVVQDERDFAVFLIEHPKEPVLDVGAGGCACVVSYLRYRGHRVVASDYDARGIRPVLLGPKACVPRRAAHLG